MSFGKSKDQQLGPGPSFVLGGLAAMFASGITHPLEVIKVRLQIQGELAAHTKRAGPFSILAKIVKTDGISGLYPGLSASLVRQSLYTTTRFTVYGSARNLFCPNGVAVEKAPLWSKMMAGATAGSIGMFIASPADMILVRMQADASLPPEQRRNYKNVFNGLSRCVKEEGFLSLYNGSKPAITRCAVSTSCQMGTYDHLKGILMQRYNMKDGIALHLCASMVAGFFTACAAAPFDTVKTRLMNTKTSSGERVYKGMTDCAVKLMRTEGVRGFYKGFTPQLLRIGPQTILIMVAYEQLANLWSKPTK